MTYFIANLHKEAILLLKESHLFSLFTDIFSNIGVPLEPTCWQLGIFKGLGVMFTESVSIGYIFLPCNSGLAK